MVVWLGSTQSPQPVPQSGQDHSPALGWNPRLLRHSPDLRSNRGRKRYNPVSKANGSGIQKLRLLQNRRLPPGWQTYVRRSNHYLTSKLPIENSEGAKLNALPRSSSLSVEIFHPSNSTIC